MLITKKVFLKITAFIVILILFLSDVTYVLLAGNREEAEETMDDAITEREALEIVATDKSISQLYSLSACLLDGDSGRVLFEKDGYTIRANASTTKIMTCLLALEYGNLDDLVEISKYAAGMPDVQLNVSTGEKYRLEDLLYSLMLESHNDVAVAIAEHIGGDVKSFAKLMNDKARELGCYNTHFITPNGLDATEIIDGKEVFHGTTAADLSRIMAYCIKNEKFLKVTQTRSHTFSNIKVDESGNTTNGSRTFTVNNKNAFLNMMDGALSGKTGFTGNAGYCYIGALNRDGKTLIVALLGCGWPNNKTYKWSDTKKLMNYGLSNYNKKDLCSYGMKFDKVTVKNGKTNDSNRKNIIEDVYLNAYIEEEAINLLVKDSDHVEIEYDISRELEAPVCNKQVVGEVVYKLNNEVTKTFPIYVEGDVEEVDYKWCFSNVLSKFFCGD